MKRNLSLLALASILVALRLPGSAAQPQDKDKASKPADSAPAQVAKAAAPGSKGTAKAPSKKEKREQKKDEPYRISFKPGTDVLSAAGEKLLTKVIQTLAAFPLYTVRVEAFAGKSEKDPESLARLRAERIRERIVSWKPPKASVMGMPLKPVSPELVVLSHSVSPKPRDAELRLTPLPDERPAAQAASTGSVP